MSEDPSLEDVWKNREEVVYPQLFGEKRRGIFVLSFEIFRDVFSQETVDPRWLHYGVFEFEPTVNRDSWLYVSSGASNPWELEPTEYSNSEYSGFGTELVLEIPTQEHWAIVILQRILAFNILLVHGRYGDKPGIDYGDRIPLRAPITLSGDSLIRNILIVKPGHYAPSFQLDSGTVDLLHCVGVTDSEVEFAKANGSHELEDVLRASHCATVTQPERMGTIDV